MPAILGAEASRPTLTQVASTTSASNGIEASAAGSSTALVAPFGAKPPELGDAHFPVYARPLYPFVVLNSGEARLLPLPKNQMFRTMDEAIHVLQEHGLNQGYRLEGFYDPTFQSVLRCETGSSCGYRVDIREVGKDAFLAISGDEGHSHGPSLRVGVFYWKRNLTLEEFSFIAKGKRHGRLKTIEEAKIAIEASRKRLDTRIPMPEPSLFTLAWELDKNIANLPSTCTSRHSSEQAVSPLRTSSAAAAAPSASVARSPAAASHPQVAPPPVDPVASTTSFSEAAASSALPAAAAGSALPQHALQQQSAGAVPPNIDASSSCDWRMTVSPVGKESQNINNDLLPTYNRPLYPFVVLDPLKARLLPPPDQEYRSQKEAIHMICEHALNQGYELATTCPGGKALVIYECQGTLCTFQAKVRRGATNLWSVVEMSGSHNHGPDLEIGVRRWTATLTSEESRFIEWNKTHGRRLLKSLEESQAVIEVSRRRLHKDIPMPIASAYRWLWSMKDKPPAKRLRTMPPEHMTHAAQATLVVFQPTASFTASSPAASIPDATSLPAVTHQSPTAGAATSQRLPSAPNPTSLANKEAFVRGLDDMLVRLWPEGLRDPQGKLRAAVTAMLNHDHEQQKQGT